MNVKDVIDVLNKTFESNIPALSEKFRVTIDPITLRKILILTDETLTADQKSIESFFANNPNGIGEFEFQKSVNEIIGTMAQHAESEHRDNIMLGDFVYSLIKLQWHIFPFCKPRRR